MSHEESYYQSLLSYSTNFLIAENQSKMNALVEAEELNKVAILKSRIFIDGKQWCVLYGDNLQDGICGFGDTPMLAIYDFNKAFHSPVVIINPKQPV